MVKFPRLATEDEQQGLADASGYPAPAIRARSSLLTLLAELVVDDALEGLEGLSARQESAIDEECRRCVYAKRTTPLIVGPSSLAKLSRVEALVERLYVEP